MAKCAPTLKIWDLVSVQNELNLEELFANQDVSKEQTEENISVNMALKDYNLGIFKVASGFRLIKFSALDDENKVDCTRVQETILDKMTELIKHTIDTITKIFRGKSLSDIASVRICITFACGVIDNLKRLLIMTGRLSELEQKFFSEEHHKLMISEESITIHVLQAIWLGSLKIMNEFYCIKNPELISGDDLTRRLMIEDESSTTTERFHKIFLMDLITCSWIYFSRTVRYDDLVRGTLSLCPCQKEAYMNLLLKLSFIDQNVLVDSLSCFIDPENYPSLASQDVRHYNVIPDDLCCKGATKPELSYFVVWHLYCISLALGKDRVSDRTNVLHACRELFNISFLTSMELFKNDGNSGDVNRLSPYQEEKFKLMFLMLNSWCELNQPSTQTVISMLSYFDNHWHLFGDNYFNKPNFRVEGLTIFQLFTKLVDHISPIYTEDGQAKDISEKLNVEERKLNEVWDKLLSRIKQNPALNKK